MTVKEFFQNEYKEFMQTVKARTWRNIQETAEYRKCNPSDVIFMDYLTITEQDIKDNGGWGGDFYQEIKWMHEQKWLASNIHRQYHGRVIVYWLTKKGKKQLGL